MLNEQKETTPAKEQAVIGFPTPRGGPELVKRLSQVRGDATRDTRMILRKAAKALDKKNMEIAAIQQQKRDLEL